MLKSDGLDPLRAAAPDVHSPFRGTPLIAGAVMFGVGWGLGGFCPGPGGAAAASLHSDALTFASAMFAAMAIVFFVDRLRAAQRADP